MPASRTMPWALMPLARSLSKYTAVYLLSERASGINAQGIVLDAGMSTNYFDKDIVRKSQRPE